MTAWTVARPVPAGRRRGRGTCGRRQGRAQQRQCLGQAWAHLVRGTADEVRGNRGDPVFEGRTALQCPSRGTQPPARACQHGQQQQRDQVEGNLETAGGPGGLGAGGEGVQRGQELPGLGDDGGGGVARQVQHGGAQLADEGRDGGVRLADAGADRVEVGQRVLQLGVGALEGLGQVLLLGDQVVEAVQAGLHGGEGGVVGGGGGGAQQQPGEAERQGQHESHGPQQHAHGAGCVTGWPRNSPVRARRKAEMTVTCASGRSRPSWAAAMVWMASLRSGALPLWK